MQKGKVTSDSLRPHLFTRVTFKILHTDRDYEEVTGLLKEVRAERVILSMRGEDRVIPIEKIADQFEKKYQRVPLESRELRNVPVHMVRQHMADRHGFPRHLLEKMQDEQAAAVHEGMDHSDLLHVHRSRDSGNGGRADAGI